MNFDANVALWGRLCARNREYEIGLMLLDAGYRDLRIDILTPYSQRGLGDQSNR